MSTNKITMEFEEKTVSARGKTFRFREITGADYDDIIKIASGPDGADMGTVLKLMVVKSCVDPHLTAEDFAAYPLPMVRLLNETVNELHFGELPGQTNGAAPEAEPVAPNA